MVCPRCGAANSDGSAQCGNCRSLLNAPPGWGNAAAAPVSSGGGWDVIIPAKNSAALTAYYLAIFSVACGALLGIPAVILGLYGLKAVKANPAVHGTVHAWIGIILGGLTTLVTLAVVVLVVIAMQQK